MAMALTALTGVWIGAALGFFCCALFRPAPIFTDAHPAAQA